MMITFDSLLATAAFIFLALALALLGDRLTLWWAHSDPWQNQSHPTRRRSRRHVTRGVTR